MTEKENLIAKLEDLANKPESKQAIDFILSCIAGSVPLAGGAISGASTHASNKSNTEFQVGFINWAKLTDAQLNDICSKISEIEKKPTLRTFSILIHELVGRYPREGEQIGVILNPNSIEELRVYERKRWIIIISTGSTVNMGAGNIVGNYIEDKKRPYGTGNSFVIAIPSWDLKE